MTDYLKLTAYFGERQRSGSQFTADALLDLYSRHEVATSIVSRGIAGFGPRHVLRTDSTLSMSEDPPIAVAAVDTADTMRPLAAEVADLIPRGLVTLERAGATPPADGRAAKLTVYIGRRQRISGRPAYVVAAELLRRHAFAGATVYLGVDGTAAGRRQRATFFSRNVEVPVMIVAVGPADRAAGAADALAGLPCTLTIEPVTLCRFDGRRLADPPAPTGGRHQKLMVHTSQAAMADGKPIHRTLVERLRAMRLTAGVTVLPGIWGYQGDAEPLRDSLFQFGRRVPVTTIVVDVPERVAAAFEITDTLTRDHGLVTVEGVSGAVTIDAGHRRGSLDREE